MRSQVQSEAGLCKATPIRCVRSRRVGVDSPESTGPQRLQAGDGNGNQHISLLPTCSSELFPKPKLKIPSRYLDQGKSLDLFCSVPGTPSANFSIQKEAMVLSRDQNFSKIAEERDSGMYRCTAGIGKVVKNSDPELINVCGECVPSSSHTRWLSRSKEPVASRPQCGFKG